MDLPNVNYLSPTKTIPIKDMITKSYEYFTRKRAERLSSSKSPYIVPILTKFDSKKIEEVYDRKIKFRLPELADPNRSLSPLDLLYFMETLKFRYSKLFQYSKRYAKIVCQVLTYDYNIITNDIDTRYFNGLKTITGFPTQFYHFFEERHKRYPIETFCILSAHQYDLVSKRSEYRNLESSADNLLKVVHFTTNRDNNSYNISPYSRFFYEINYLLYRSIREMFRSRCSIVNTIGTTKLTRKKLYMKTFVTGIKVFIKNKNIHLSYIPKGFKIYEPEEKRKLPRTKFRTYWKGTRYFSKTSKHLRRFNWPNFTTAILKNDNIRNN